jgi:hypothetical protein
MGKFQKMDECRMVVHKKRTVMVGVILLLLPVFFIWFVFFKEKQTEFTLIDSSKYNTSKSLIFATIINNEGLERWESAIGKSIVNNNFLDTSYLCITNVRLTGIHYRRYEKYRLSKPWFYCHVHYSSAQSDSIFIYRIPKVYVITNDNSSKSSFIFQK